MIGQYKDFEIYQDFFVEVDQLRYCYVAVNKKAELLSNTGKLELEEEELMECMFPDIYDLEQALSIYYKESINLKIHRTKKELI